MASYSDHTAVTRQEVNFRVIHHITEEDPSQEAPTYMQMKESFENENDSPLVHRKAEVLKADMQRYVSQKTVGSTKEALIAYIEQIQREE